MTMENMKQPAVYIMANRRNGTLYTGVTSNLAQRAYQHRSGQTPGFAARYGCKRLVYYESLDTMQAAIAREKQLKAGSRRKKLLLIESTNPIGAICFLTWFDVAGIGRPHPVFPRPSGGGRPVLASLRGLATARPKQSSHRAFRLDCFVAPLLAMTKGAPRVIR